MFIQRFKFSPAAESKASTRHLCEQLLHSRTQNMKVVMDLSLQKCVLYWPEKRGIYGDVEVLVDGVREREHFTTRSLTLKVRATSCRQSSLQGSQLNICFVPEQCGNQTRTLQHYWYTSWPDHKTPDSALPLLQLMADVEADRRAADRVGPVIVHCRYPDWGAPPPDMSERTPLPMILCSAVLGSAGQAASSPWR